MTAEDKSVADIPAQEMPEKYKEWLFERFFAYNLKFMLSAKVGEQ